jgi:hypothetical protein
VGSDRQRVLNELESELSTAAEPAGDAQAVLRSAVLTVLMWGQQMAPPWVHGGRAFEGREGRFVWTWGAPARLTPPSCLSDSTCLTEAIPNPA